MVNVGRFSINYDYENFFPCKREEKETCSQNVIWHNCSNYKHGIKFSQKMVFIVG